MNAMTLWLVEMLLGVVGAVSARLRRRKHLGRKGYSSIIWSVRKKRVSGIRGCGPESAWPRRTLPLPQGMFVGSWASPGIPSHIACVMRRPREAVWRGTHVWMLGAVTFVMSLPLLPRLCRKCDNDDPDFLQRLRILREAMSQNTGQFDFAFSEPELLQVLQELPANRAPGPDGLTYEVFRVDDDIFRAALLCFFELVRSWAITCRHQTVTQVRLSGGVHELPAHQLVVLQSKDFRETCIETVIASHCTAN